MFTDLVQFAELLVGEINSLRISFVRTLPLPLTCPPSLPLTKQLMLPEPEIPAYTSVASRSAALILPDPDMLYFAAPVMPLRVMLPDPEMLQSRSYCRFV